MTGSDLAAWLSRWGETVAAICAVVSGLWLLGLGGWLFWALGAVTLAASSGWAVLAWRRARFGRGAAAPGVVEVDEGQVGYFGPSFGGFVALADLVELRLVGAREHAAWRLKTGQGEMLTIPVGARGAERLFEAFSSLPGMDTGALVRALDSGEAGATVWSRPQPLGGPARPPA